MTKVHLVKNELQKQFDNIKYKVLPNGLKIIFIENKNYSEYYVNFQVKYGSNNYKYLKGGNEYITPHGIAHFLEHMMFNMPYGDAFTKFSQNQASANAYTTYDKTSYLFSCKEKFIENLDVLLNMVTTPFFPNEKVKKELSIIREEINMYKKDEFYNLYKESLKKGIPDSAFSIDILGEYNDISKIDENILLEVFEDQYTPSNEVLILAGPDLKDGLDHIENYFENFDKRNNGVIENISNNHKKFANNNQLNFNYEKKIHQNYMSSIKIYKETSKKQEILKNRIIMQLILEITYSDFSENYINASEKNDLNSSFNYEYIVEEDFIFTAFYMTGNNFEKFQKFIEKNDISHQDVRNFEKVKNKFIGRILKRFNKSKSMVEFLAQIDKYNMSVSELMEILNSIQIVDVQILQNRLKAQQMEKITINFIKNML